MLKEKIENTIQKYNLINEGDKILIGVSGGPDSVALLYLLNELRKQFKLGLHIAHLDHGLRTGSSRDRKFVESLAKKLNLEITSDKINIKVLAAKGSIEEIARNARLAFLFKTAKEVKAAKIALGHNLDDQAETLLMRILRGTGLYGLAGILPIRKISGFKIIRPLIETERKQILTYLKKKKVSPRIDSSNLKDIYFRNKIRNKLMPQLEKQYNPHIKTALANLAQISASDYDFLLKAGQRALSGTSRNINLKKYLELHPAIQRLALRQAISRTQGNTRRITFKHIAEIQDMIANRPVNSIVNLPKGVLVTKTKKSLKFFRRLP